MAQILFVNAMVLDADRYRLARSQTRHSRRRREGIFCPRTLDDAIDVGEFGRTEAPEIFAAGDSTNHYNRIAGRRVRVESVQNATDQGKAAGKISSGRGRGSGALNRR